MTEPSKAGPFYIVDDDREHPAIEWVTGVFTRKRDAEEYTDDIGGKIKTAADGIEELIEAWRAGDFSRQAHHEAEWTLAMFRHDLLNISLNLFEEDRALVERYKDTDPSCAVVLRAFELLQEALRETEKIIPPGTTHFQGVHIEGEWKHSIEELREIGKQARAENAEALAN